MSLRSHNNFLLVDGRIQIRKNNYGSGSWRQTYGSGSGTLVKRKRETDNNETASYQVRTPKTKVVKDIKTRRNRNIF
jgi:hypothetical protein